MPDLDHLETALGHHFKNRQLLFRALTHSSRVHEIQAAEPSGSDADNEQMEFLGDSVLGFLISESLVQRFPSYPEGRLSKLKAHLVSAAHLYEVARELELGQYLILGRGEEMSGGRAKRTLLVDCLEALLAALYLDGGIEVTRNLVNHWVIGDRTRLTAQVSARGLDEEILGAPIVDFKSALQELAQVRKLPQPRYVIVSERGPEHSKTFTIEARVGREWSSQAEGFSKKSAAQKAARGVFDKLMEEGTSP
jgi:ribonuclease III